MFPPVIYSLYWAVLLFASSVSYIRYGSLPTNACLVFFAGCVVFSFAGEMAMLLFDRNRNSGRQITEGRRHAIQNLIMLFNLILVIMIPTFIKELREAGDSLQIGRFAVGARIALGQINRSGVSRLFLSLVSIGSFIAYYAAWVYRGSRRDKITLAAAILGPLGMSVVTFARTPVFFLIVGVLAILLFHSRISKVKVFVTLALAVSLMLGMGSYLDKNPNIGLSKTATMEILSSVGIYYIGGPFGFGQVMDNPTTVGEPGLSLRFFTQAMKSAGIDIYLPTNILDYYDYRMGNIYTAYFAYWLDGEWIGVLIYAILAGFISSVCFILAYRKNMIAGAALGLIFSSLLNSAVGDGLFGSSVPWLLIIGIGCIFLYLPFPRFLSLGSQGRRAQALKAGGLIR